MVKKVLKKVTEVKKVKVKIAGYPMHNYLAIMKSGTEVEMSEKDKKAVDQGFKSFEKAQKILEKHLLIAHKN